MFTFKVKVMPYHCIAHISKTFTWKTNCLCFCSALHFSQFHYRLVGSLWALTLQITAATFQEPKISQRSFMCSTMYLFVINSTTANAINLQNPPANHSQNIHISTSGYQMDINQSLCLFCLFFTLLTDISHNLTHFLKDWVIKGEAAMVLQPGSVIFFQGI